MKTIFRKKYEGSRLPRWSYFLTLWQAECLLHSLEEALRGITLYINSDETEFMYFKQDGSISTINKN